MVCKQLLHVARDGQADVRVDVDLADAAGDGGHELVNGDAVGVLDIAAEVVDLADDVLRDGGAAVAHQGAEDAQAVDALLDGDGDLAAQLGVLALVRAVLRAVGNREGIHAGLFDEGHGVQRIGVGAGLGKDVVLLPAEDAQLALDADAERVSVFDDLARELYVLLQRQGGAVDHHGGVAAVDGGDAAFDVLAVVEVQHHGDRAVLAVLAHGVRDAARADLLVLQRAVGEVHAAAHEGVGQVRALQYGGGAEGLVHLDDGLGLGHGVDVERALRVVVLFGGLHQGAKGNERHNFILL